MNQQDRSFLITFTTVMSVLVLVAVVIFMVSRLVSFVSVDVEEVESREATEAEERIRPIGQVQVAEAPSGQAGETDTHGTQQASRVPPVAQSGTSTQQSAPTTMAAAQQTGGQQGMAQQPAQPMAVSGQQMAATAQPAVAPGGAAGFDLAQGEQVYTGACVACHSAGVLGAPVMGDEAAWQTRYQQGLDTLVSHAVNGYNAMPAKGGNPSLTEDEIRNAVVYMLEQSNISVPAPQATQVAAAAPPATRAKGKNQGPSSGGSRAAPKILSLVKNSRVIVEET